MSLCLDVRVKPPPPNLSSPGGSGSCGRTMGLGERTGQGGGGKKVEMEDGFAGMQAAGYPEPVKQKGRVSVLQAAFHYRCPLMCVA